MTDYTLVGQIINTHGVKGGLRIYPYTFDINRYKEYGEIFIGEDKTPVTITKIQFHKNLVIAYFDGYDNINQVEHLKEEYLFIPRSKEAKLEKGKYYIDDIRGLTVVDTKGNIVGTIKDVLVGAANDVFEIEYKGSSYYVPAVKEFIKSIDLDGEVVIDPIKGMLDES